MYVAIILLPLLNSFLGLFGGRFFDRNMITMIILSGMSLNVLLSLYCFYEVMLCGSLCTLNLGTWMETRNMFIDWFLVYDPVCVVMLIVVNVVSLCVHVYSVRYMDHDPHFIKFMSFLSLFTFFMLVLVTAGNFPQLFIGWEGVGLASFLLISFWSTRQSAVLAAVKAMLVNRVGDLGLMLSFAVIYFVFNSLDFGVIFGLAPAFVGEQINILGFSFDVLSLITALIFIGAVGKSAQFGLHVWLPDAMEGPTPVSALIHAATMVTAGVFVIIRCSPLFELTPKVLTVVALIGGITALFSAMCGCVQYDLKKVIAYSTCSQLGYMVFVCGLSGYSIALFHLMNHAFFKALLFLSAGAIIHAVNDEQDMRKMGGLVNLLPFTYLMVFVGSLALMGFPFLTGFYSKDVILEVALVNWSFDGRFVYWLGISAAFFTAYYSTRLLYLTFLSKAKGVSRVYEYATESDIFVVGPLVVLFFGSVFVGFIFKDMFIGVGSDVWLQSIYVNPGVSGLTDGEFLPWFLKLIPFFVSLAGVALGFFISLVFQGKTWSTLLKSSGENFIYMANLVRNQFNLMIMYDFLLCAVFVPWLITKVIYNYVFSMFETMFLHVIFLIRETVYLTARFLSELHSGSLAWYFVWFYSGIIFILFIYFVFAL